jgi:hypothetical protein
VYLDDDIEVAEDWLLGYFDAVDELDADCVVGPVYPKFECDPPDFLTERVLDSVISTYSRKGDRMMLLPSNVAHEVPGSNFALRKSAAFSVGGFNNGLDRVGTGLLAGGDWEFGLRLVASSCRVVYQPRCSIYHVITSEKLSRKHLRKRWAGLGATTGVLNKRSDRLPLWRRVRYHIGVVRLVVSSFLHLARGDVGIAFQCELEARRSWSYLYSTTMLQNTERIRT